MIGQLYSEQRQGCNAPGEQLEDISHRSLLLLLLVCKSSLLMARAVCPICLPWLPGRLRNRGCLAAHGLAAVAQEPAQQRWPGLF